MRVMWMIDGLGHGGAERMTLSVLEKFDLSRFDMRVCALQVKQGNPIAEELKRIGIPVDLVSISKLRNASNIPVITKYLRKHRPDVLHTQLEFSNILGSISAWMLRIPNVSTIHSIDAPKEGTHYWRNQLSWACMRNFSTRLISVSESTRAHQIKYGHVSPNKIFTIYNGIDPLIFKPLDQEVRLEKRKELNIPENAFVFITIAVLRELKGIQYMIEAMAGITKYLNNAHYLIVGAGEYEPQIREKIKTLNLEKYITLAGQRTDISEMLSASDLFVLPTLLDALPTVLIEAMAAGKAIIASNVGGVPEIVENGVNGVLVTPADPRQLEKSCLDIAQDQGKREAMEDAGIKIMQKKFNVHNQVSALIQTYEELTNHG